MIATTVLAIAIGVLILVLVRRDHMHGAYAVWWVLVALAVLVVGLFPGWIDRLGHELGVHYPPILVLVSAICVLFLKALTMDIERSRQEGEIRKLAQRMAVLERMIEEQRQPKDQ